MYTFIHTLNKCDDVQTEKKYLLPNPRPSRITYSFGSFSASPASPGEEIQFQGETGRN